MSNMLKKAETLFLAIGTVDDELVAEALTANKAKKRLFQRKPFLYTAVATAAVLLIAFSIFSAGFVNRIFGVITMPRDERTHLSLQHTMAEAAESANITKAAAEDINFFSGDTYIIWREKGQDQYCLMQVRDSADARYLKDEMGDYSSSIPPEDTADDCMLWISYGDGRVLSPYLKESAGNIGYAKLFDYTAEVYPNEGLMELVNDLIAQEA